MGPGAAEQGAVPVGETPDRGGGARRGRRGRREAPAWRAAGPEPCPAGKWLRPGENSSPERAGWRCWGTRRILRSCWPWVLSPSLPGRWRQPGPSECKAAEPEPTRNLRWPACAGVCRAQPQFPPVPLPPHRPTSRRSRLRPWPDQRQAPTVQRRGEGLLKRGQSGRRGRGGTESEQGLPARCHLSLSTEAHISSGCPLGIAQAARRHPLILACGPFPSSKAATIH
ncbi:uncharacterized protein LOC129136965 [Pan troglodytes]|uniref:uncharacterized protein LOC129136965 n=1 Tax=Pan troglodytes TaxID=9598 RepID=UPI0023EF5D64|nr:uncharacterized protein LOC129136965 [Pan troglodytes]